MVNRYMQIIVSCFVEGASRILILLKYYTVYEVSLKNHGEHFTEENQNDA